MNEVAKHSGVGIASFVISVVIGILIFLTILIAGVIATQVGYDIDDDSIEVIMVGFAIIILLFFDLVACGLGIAGLCQHNRKKIFALLGTIFSSLIFLGTIALMVVGNMMD